MITKTKIKGRFVIGYDQSLEDHVVYQDGEVVYQGDSVIFVGHNYPNPVDREMDMGNSIVGPGFIDLNALADLDTTVMEFDERGNDSTAKGKQWSAEYAKSNPHEISTLSEAIQDKNRYALVQLIRRGTTTALPVTGLLYRKWAESKVEYDEIAKVAVELGLRTYLGPSYRSGVNVITTDGKMESFWDEQQGLEGLKENIEFIKEHDGEADGLIRGLLVPSTIETCSKELLAATKQAAGELGVPIRLHATQSYGEFRMIKERHGMTPIAYMDSMGLLDENLLLPHGIYVNGYSKADCGEGDDLKILARTNTTVLHCPFVISRSGIAMESFRKYKDLGINIALATDCYPSDMILNMLFGVIMCRSAEGNPGAVTTADMYRAATLGGARALNRDDLGRLCQGSKADIMVLSLDGFHIGQIDDPIRTMVLNANGMDVTDVIINGRDVMRHKQIPNVDYTQLHLQSQNYFQKLKASFGERDYLKRSPEVLFPASFKTYKKA